MPTPKATPQKSSQPAKPAKDAEDKDAEVVTPDEHIARVRQDRASERDVILGYPSPEGGDRQDERDADGEGYETDRSGAV